MEKEKNKGGRPRKEIDQKQFENLCALQCTAEEISGWFDVCEDTLDSWCKRTYKMGFSATFAQKRQGGKISLRRAQFQLAKKSASMAIWLGKQWLGQRDVVEMNGSSEVTVIHDDLGSIDDSVQVGNLE